MTETAGRREEDVEEGLSPIEMSRSDSWPERAALEVSFQVEDAAEGNETSLKLSQMKNLSPNKSKAAFMPKPKTPMPLLFRDVCCFVPSHFQVPGVLPQVSKVFEACTRKRGGEMAPAPSSKERQILYNITGTVYPGEMVAIMGPSGSGKTTFISLLAGRNSARHTGDILYNGEHQPTDKAFKRCLGYVTQEDAMFEGLTVFETLFYTAMLRLPRAMTKAEKRQRAEIIMECLGITRVKDSIIGGFRVARRGISGGEKKRVAIGQELLYNPSVILLDEPTSGLDSTTALNLIHTLHTLAQAGNRTILTTIHQPSSRIYQMLDKLLLMGLGHLLYYGDASVACDYFTKIGYAMPYGMNPADYFLDIASGWSGESEDNNTIDASDPELKHLLKAIEAQPYSRESSSKFNDLVLSTRSVESERELFGMTWKSSARDLQSPSREGPTFWTQMTVIAIRSLKDRRFERFSSDSMMTVFFMAFLCGILWWQAGTGGSLSTYVGALDVTAVLFFIVTFLSFNTLFSAIFTFPNEKTMLLKERGAGIYPISAFFFGRTLADLPLDTGIPVVVSTIIYIMVGLLPQVKAYVLTMVVVLLTCFTAGSLGLLIGAWFLNLKRAQSAATVIMLTIMLTGGFLVKDIPVWIAWIRYLSYILYAWNALVNIHLKGRIPDCEDSSADSSMCEDTLLGDMKFGNIGFDIGILAVMLVILRTGVYLALRFGAKAK